MGVQGLGFRVYGVEGSIQGSGLDLGLRARTCSLTTPSGSTRLQSGEHRIEDAQSTVTNTCFALGASGFGAEVGVCCVLCGVWGVGCGVWCVVCGVGCVVCGVWCVAFGVDG